LTCRTGVWTHGDLIRVDAQTKGIYVLGRRYVVLFLEQLQYSRLTGCVTSDGVLNPSGVRFGTSDLYNVLSYPEIAEDVLDSIAVGQQRVAPPYSDPTERVILFLKMSSRARTKTTSPRKALVKRIWQHIGRDLSKRHIPTFIFEVDEIPYNANGKKMEIQLKAVCNNGGDALATMKLTEKERKVLGDYTRFFHVESLFSPGKVNL
jgi:acetoacetyl-CoA synthetase